MKIEVESSVLSDHEEIKPDNKSSQSYKTHTGPWEVNNILLVLVQLGKKSRRKFKSF